jgi:chromate transporter
MTPNSSARREEPIHVVTAGHSIDKPAAPVRWPTLFIAFSQMALTGFGGVMPFAYRALVEKRRWLTEQEFSQYLAFSQMLPGPTICNMAAMIGWRFARWRGAVAAFAGVLLGPMLLVLALGIAYARFATHPVVRHVLVGMSAIAAGLVIATAMKMALGLSRGDRRWERLAPMGLIGVAAFAGVGVMGWPLITVAAVLAPLSIALAWAQSEPPSSEQP